MKKGTESIEKVLGAAAGVNEDGTPVIAYERVKQLQQQQLQLVRERLQYYMEEEKRLLDALAKYPSQEKEDGG